MTSIANTIKKIVNQRKMLIKNNLSKKNKQMCQKYIDYCSRYIDAYGDKWQIASWAIFARKNYEIIAYLSPTNKSGEALLLNLKNMIGMKKINIILVGKTRLNGELKKYDHENVESISVITEDMSENLKLIASADLIVCVECFDICKISDKVIQIARLADKQVIHHSRFLEYVSTVNN